MEVNNTCYLEENNMISILTNEAMEIVTQPNLYNQQNRQDIGEIEQYNQL